MATNNQRIRKAVEAIGIFPTVGNITLTTRKIWNVLLHRAQQEGEKDRYSMKLSDLVRQSSRPDEIRRIEVEKIKADTGKVVVPKLGKLSSDAALVKEHLKKMNTIQVEWNVLRTDGRHDWGVANLIAEATVSEEANGYVIGWSYPPSLRAKFLDPTRWAVINLQIYSGLRSGYAAALYEFCCRYVKTESYPSGLTCRNHWQWWRPRITGVPEGEAKETSYKYFKRDVLLSAINEINRLTDIDVSLKEFREGRAVEDIQFEITLKSQFQQSLLQEENQVEFNQAITDRMKALGVSDKDVAKIYADHGAPEIKDAFIVATLDLVEERARNKDLTPLQSKAAFFKKALKGRYADAVLIEQEVKKETKAKDQAKKEAEKIAKNEAGERTSARNAAAMERFNGLPDDLKSELEDKFYDLHTQFKRSAPKSIMYKSTFSLWLADQFGILPVA